jgi:hypothetical protein
MSFLPPGTDVMLFEKFSPKVWRKKLAFFVQNAANFRKIVHYKIGF